MGLAPGDFTGDDEQDDVYEISILSVEQCKSDDGYNLSEPVVGFTCENILYRAWKECKSPFHFPTTLSCPRYL